MSLPKNFQQIFFWILAYVSVIGLTHMFFYAEGQPPLTNSIFTIFVWVALAQFFCKIFPIANKRLLICSTILGSFFSACMIFGANIFSIDTAAINSFTTWRNIILGTPFFAAIIIWLFTIIPKINCINFFDKWEKNLTAKKYFLITWILIFVAWLPAFLSQYPGIYGYDIIGQTLNYQIWRENDVLINADHPVAHTFFSGFCIVTLGNLFGSYERGMAIQTIIQMALMAFALALISWYMFKKNLSRFWRIVWLIFFMFFPLIHIMAISATKNILFATFFVMLILTLFMAVDEKVFADFQRPKIFYSTTIILSFLMIVFINQGIYVFIFGMLAGLLIAENLRIKIFKIMLVCIFLNFAYTNLFLGMILKVHADKKHFIQEVIGVPAVQLARVGIYRKDELTEEELQELQRYIPFYKNYEDKLKRGSSDWTRLLGVDVTVEDVPKIFNFYKKMAWKYPNDYLDAFLRLTAGEWYPDLYYQINVTEYQPYFQYESFFLKDDGIMFVENPFSGSSHQVFNLNDFEILKMYGYPIHSKDELLKIVVIVKNHTIDGFNWLHKFYQNLAYKYTYERVPVVSMLFSTGFIFWLIVTYTFWIIYKKKYRLLFPISFLIAHWGTLILGPMELFRYTLPLALCIPILFTHMSTEK